MLKEIAERIKALPPLLYNSLLYTFSLNLFVKETLDKNPFINVVEKLKEYY